MSSISTGLFPYQFFEALHLEMAVVYPFRADQQDPEQEMHWGELLRYLGLWFLVGGGYKKKDFWSTLYLTRERILAHITSGSTCLQKDLMPSLLHSASQM